MRASQATSYPPSCGAKSFACTVRAVVATRSSTKYKRRVARNRNARFKRTGVHILVPSAYEYRARERTTSARSPVACTVR
eukprot:scaffold421464_cov18-Prasinocladus_malaysianus.AAC.1